MGICQKPARPWRLCPDRRQAPRPRIACNFQGLQPGQLAQFGGNGSRQPIASQQHFFQPEKTPQGRRDRACQHDATGLFPSRSPIEKSLLVALAQPGGEESSPGRGGGIAVSDGAGTVGPGSQRVRVGVVGRGGGGQRRGPAQIPGNPAVRGQVAARIRVRWATVAVR